MNTPIPDDKMAVIKDAIFKGQKIAAIKHYREATGVGLAEAKNAVEVLESQLRTNDPASFQQAQPTKSSGCFSLVLVLVAAAIGVSVYFAMKH